MTEISLIIILALALLACGKWRQRARDAERDNEQNRKAHDIQNRVAADPAYRERVRRQFDRP